jgi:hypothetical protein
VREQFDTLVLAAPVGRPRRLDAALDSMGVERVRPARQAAGMAALAALVADGEALPADDGALVLAGTTIPLVDVDRRRREAQADPHGGGFDVRRLPAGVGWSTRHDPRRGSVSVQAAIPAAKRLRDGTLRTAGTTGREGVSVVVGRWGSEPVEWAQVQVSSKALHDGDNVLPMQGGLDLAQALDLAGTMLDRLGYAGPLDDAAVARFDSVVDFTGVEAHGRYVAAFGDNAPPIRGGRHVMHADETLALHFNKGMSRLYNKARESPGNPLAVGRSRYELERKRARLTALGMDNVRSLDLARLDREARRMFEQSGYDREVAPLSEWAWRLLSCVPVDEDGAPLPGFTAATKRGAMMHALLVRMGVDPQTHRNTLSKYRRLYEAAGVSMDDVSLVETAGDVVFLDLESQTERRRPRRSA